MLGYALEPTFVVLQQLGHNQRDAKTLIRHYQRAFDETQDHQRKGASPAKQILRARRSVSAAGERGPIPVQSPPSSSGQRTARARPRKSARVSAERR